MKKIEKIIAQRRHSAKLYNELISKIDNIEPQKIVKNARHTYQSYTCVITKPNKRDKIIKKLADENIESQIGTYALHMLPVFNKFKNQNLKNSEFLYKNSISLPLHHELSMTDQKLICGIIQNVLNK